MSRATEFWINSVLSGYITEFDIDCTKSYSAAQRDFFRGPHGSYLKVMNLWIKMALCDKGISKMESDN